MLAGWRPSLVATSRPSSSTPAKPLGDQPDPSIADPMFDEPDQPILASLVEKGLNVATPQSVSQCRFPFVRHIGTDQEFEEFENQREINVCRPA
jgi:hypothetical protein